MGFTGSSNSAVIEILNQMIEMDLEGIAQDLEEINTNVIAMKTSVDNMESTVDEMSPFIESMSANIEQIQLTLDGINDDFPTLLSNQDTTNDWLSQIRTINNFIGNDVEQLRQIALRSETLIDDIDSNVQTINTNVADTNYRMRTYLIPSVDAIKLSVSSIDTKIDNLQTSLDSILSELDSQTVLLQSIDSKIGGSGSSETYLSQKIEEGKVYSFETSYALSFAGNGFKITSLVGYKLYGVSVTLDLTSPFLTKYSFGRINSVPTVVQTVSNFKAGLPDDTTNIFFERNNDSLESTYFRDIKNLDIGTHKILDLNGDSYPIPLNSEGSIGLYFDTTSSMQGTLYFNLILIKE